MTSFSPAIMKKLSTDDIKLLGKVNMFIDREASAKLRASPRREEYTQAFKKTQELFLKRQAVTKWTLAETHIIQDKMRKAFLYGYDAGTMESTGWEPTLCADNAFRILAIYFKAWQIANDPKNKTQASISFDNPGGQWLKNKQEDVVLRAKGRNGYVGKMLTGATTAYTEKPVKLPLTIFKHIQGAMDEKRHEGDPQFDALLSDVTKDGWDEANNKKYPVLIGVNHLGVPYLLEGNTRVAVANKIGRKDIWATIRWFNGGEDSDGIFNPTKLTPYVKHVVEAAVNGPLYHYTSPEAAASILKAKKLKARPSISTQSDNTSGKAAHFFISFSREKAGSFARRNAYNWGVIFDFDGHELERLGKLRPIDFWGQRGATRINPHDLGNGEAEERLEISKPAIDITAKNLKAVHLLAKGTLIDNPKSTPEQRDINIAQTCIAVVSEAKKLGVPVFIYDSSLNFFQQAKQRAVPVKALMGRYDEIKKSVPEDDKHAPYVRNENRKNYTNREFSAVIQMFMSDDYNKLSKDARKLLYNWRRGWREDSARSLQASMHNMNSRPNDIGRKMLERITTLMGKHKMSGVNQMIDFLVEKWSPIAEAWHEKDNLRWRKHYDAKKARQAIAASDDPTPQAITLRYLSGFMDYENEQIIRPLIYNKDQNSNLVKTWDGFFDTMIVPYYNKYRIAKNQRFRIMKLVRLAFMLGYKDGQIAGAIQAANNVLTEIRQNKRKVIVKQQKSNKVYSGITKTPQAKWITDNLRSPYVGIFTVRSPVRRFVAPFAWNIVKPLKPSTVWRFFVFKNLNVLSLNDAEWEMRKAAKLLHRLYAGYNVTFKMTLLNWDTGKPIVRRGFVTKTFGEVELDKKRAKFWGLYDGALLNARVPAYTVRLDMKETLDEALLPKAPEYYHRQAIRSIAAKLNQHLDDFREATDNPRQLILDCLVAIQDKQVEKDNVEAARDHYRADKHFYNKILKKQTQELTRFFTVRLMDKIFNMGGIA